MSNTSVAASSSAQSNHVHPLVLLVGMLVGMLVASIISVPVALALSSRRPLPPVVAIPRQPGIDLGISTTSMFSSSTKGGEDVKEAESSQESTMITTTSRTKTGTLGRLS